jgi:hypothetical protein
MAVIAIISITKLYKLLDLMGLIYVHLIQIKSKVIIEGFLCMSKWIYFFFGFFTIFKHLIDFQEYLI